MATITGTVKWFDFVKHYGYIAGDDGKDHFVHASGITEGRHYKGLVAGDKVEFEVTDGKKGQQAANVVLTEKAPTPPPKKNVKSEDDVPAKNPDVNETDE